jgi:hypothetical protein
MEKMRTAYRVLVGEADGKRYITLEINVYGRIILKCIST